MTTPPASLPSPSPDILREAIAAHCRVGSWFALRPLLVRMLAPHLVEAGPELLADLRAGAGGRCRTEADRLQRLLSQRQWHASAIAATGPRQAITVHCGGWRATLHLLARPLPHIETIGR